MSKPMLHIHRHAHLPRRRPREGHRRGEIRRRVQRPRPCPCQRRHLSDRQGPHRRIDASEALRVDGVIDVLTHENRPRMADNDKAYKDDVAPGGSPFRPLYDDKIMFNGQPVALVLAEDAETARFAASLVRVEYEEEPQRHRHPCPAGRGVSARRGHLRAHAREAARRRRGGLRGRRCAPRGRILRADRAPQSDGAVRHDRDRGTAAASSRSTTRRRACRTSSATLSASST